MRFIVLKTEVSAEHTLNILGLAEINYKSSKITPTWIDFKKAITDCSNPEKCELLSFEDEDEIAEILENIDMSDDSTVCFIGVDA